MVRANGKQKIWKSPETIGLGVILVSFIGLTFLYDITVPLFEKPDELKHFAVIQHIQTSDQLPVVREGIYRPWDQEGTQPPLYHLLTALMVSGLDLTGFSEPPRNPHYADNRSFEWEQIGNNNLYLHPPYEQWLTDPVLFAGRVARWVSIVAGVTTIPLVYWLATIIFIGPTPVESSETEKLRFTIANGESAITRRIPLLSAALLVGVPQYLHVSSAITNDSLSVPLAAATLVVLMLILQNGASLRYILLLGGLLGLSALTKLSLLYMFPLAGLVLLLDLSRHHNFRKFILHGFIIAGAFTVLAGWWFARNWYLYHDPTAIAAHLLYRGGALDPTPSLATIWQTELVGLELSYWAAFGAGQILLPSLIYDGLRWLRYLVFTGVLIGFFRVIRYRLRGSGQDSKDAGQFVSLWGLVILLLWAVINFVALMRWMQITPASWGRLLYPSLPAIALLAAWGLSQFSVLGTLVPKPNNSRPGYYLFAMSRSFLYLLPWLVVVTLFLLSLTIPLQITNRAYARTPLISEAELPADVQPVDLYFGPEALRLVGYRVGQDVALPDTWFPVTLYWQATQPISKNYSTFVHIITPAGDAVAQTNTYPDGGRWATSMLPSGEVLPATYHVYIPPHTSTPLAGRVAVGIFEFDDPQRAAKVAVDKTGQPVIPIFDGIPIVPRQWPSLSPAEPLEAIFDRHIKLIGIDPINNTISPGASVPLTLYWQTIEPPGKDLNLFIHLINPVTGEQVAGFDGPPSFPTRYWTSGSTLVDARDLSFPPDLLPGEYLLKIGWYNLEDFARLPIDSAGSDNALTVGKIHVKRD
jgi:4-amino-4-deoxy-L-arabinose transferase-like glycosyltransferase